MILRNIYIGILCFIPFFIFCQAQKAGAPKKIYSKVTIGPAICFYGNNNFHTSNTRPGAAFYGTFTEEGHIIDNIYASAGLEYQYSSMSFNSYYMAPGYQYLYNQKYDFNYTLNMHETRLNILMRLTSGTELTKPYTAYIEGGYVLRYLMNTNMKVVSDLNNQVLFDGTTHTNFIGNTIKNSCSSGLKVSAGIQHNFLKSHRAWFIQISYMQGLARFLVHESFTPASIYIKTSYLQLGLGYKF